MSQMYRPHYGAEPLTGVRGLEMPGGEKLTRADCKTTKIPADGKAGYEPGCELRANDGVNGLVKFINTGTAASCAFRQVLLGASSTATQLTATVAQLNSVAAPSGRVVTTTATSLILSSALHANRILLINTNSSGTSTFTMPAVTGSGDRYTIVNGIVQTQGTIVIALDPAVPDTFNGVVAGLHTTTTTGGEAFIAVANKSTITLNKTTTGGLGFDWFEMVDIGTSWLLKGQISGSGTLASPMS